MSSPRSIRFSDDVYSRLMSYVNGRPGVNLSSVTNRFVDEILRMLEHPGIVFKDGPRGRRASLSSGLDIAEMVRIVKEAKSDNPGVKFSEIADIVIENTGATINMINSALAYYSSFPHEIDAAIEAHYKAVAEAELTWSKYNEITA